ncbi:hypothetical protein BDV96DRAFT_655773 [Lophiotrema nucula]|uniref:Inhibitor I9 domain-containing protein n=1 Tax=Lophiotrema nucula TaxID=690887 RepID=A0A6A5YDB0_9PLEO|nr:hypothetical protein BDV96DRAFT_655773 [Lophiotrema nucula]
MRSIPLFPVIAQSLFSTLLSDHLARDTYSLAERAPPTTTDVTDTPNMETSTTTQRRDDTPKAYMVVLQDPADEVAANKTRDYIATGNQDELKLPGALHDSKGRVRAWGAIYLSDDDAKKLKQYPGVKGVAEDPGLDYLRALPESDRKLTPIPSPITKMESERASD